MCLIHQTIAPISAIFQEFAANTGATTIATVDLSEDGKPAKTRFIKINPTECYFNGELNVHCQMKLEFLGYQF